MKVSLISNTPDALNLLLRTKNTRLSYDSDPAHWSPEEKAEHLKYMLTTIKSSWEFVDYTFRIEGVTRAFTHQLVRTRTGAYAQQSLRVVNAAEHPVTKPATVERNADANEAWDAAIEIVGTAYGDMVDLCGIPLGDARGILPTNVQTDIIAKFSLRTLHEMAKVRLCTRTQGEYQDVFRAMREAVVEVHPWADPFIQVQCVADGTCAFPRYGEEECPVYFPDLNQDAVKQKAHKRFWSSARYEAAPVAKNGRT